MPDATTLKALREDIQSLKIEKQYKIMLDWDANRLTGEEAIFKIVQEEKMEYFPTSPEFLDFIKRKQESN